MCVSNVCMYKSDVYAFTQRLYHIQDVTLDQFLSRLQLI